MRQGTDLVTGVRGRSSSPDGWSSARLGSTRATAVRRLRRLTDDQTLSVTTVVFTPPVTKCELIKTQKVVACVNTESHGWMNMHNILIWNI